ncbi:hypothetical protein T440DRAFT_534420 [Plenodomus tracheiphilus IPT5]|uniref:non-specific serine/threonine protein kinase n=1 Tax=Plenodomus tracheiphilus IPT5 TaxID=1408161 RepID=A0A6A7B0V2_9PLEO|nr:hypothetical protein T440DRAFT_534420 [Plenodomus tracheiphilus IPT5]
MAMWDDVWAMGTAGPTMTVGVAGNRQRATLAQRMTKTWTGLALPSPQQQRERRSKARPGSQLECASGWLRVARPRNYGRAYRGCAHAAQQRAMATPPAQTEDAAVLGAGSWVLKGFPRRRQRRSQQAEHQRCAVARVGARVPIGQAGDGGATGGRLGACTAKEAILLGAACICLQAGKRFPRRALVAVELPVPRAPCERLAAAAAASCSPASCLLPRGLRALLCSSSPGADSGSTVWCQRPRRALAGWRASSADCGPQNTWAHHCRLGKACVSRSCLSTRPHSKPIEPSSHHRAVERTSPAHPIHPIDARTPARRQTACSHSRPAPPPAYTDTAPPYDTIDPSTDRVAPTVPAIAPASCRRRQPPSVRTTASVLACHHRLPDQSPTQHDTGGPRLSIRFTLDPLGILTWSHRPPRPETFERRAAMDAPNADLTAAGATPAHPTNHTPPPARNHGASPPRERQDSSPAVGVEREVEENDCTPRSELLPAVPEALSASLLTPSHTLDPEPSYFSPQPLRLYSSPIPRSTPASTTPSPASSTNASATSLAIAEQPVDDAARASGLPPPSDRPAFQRDISSASTASNTTVRANAVDVAHTYTFAAHARQRDGPVYPNQSYAALHLQQHPLPHVPPIVRSRSTHPAHSAANSLSSLGSFGIHNDHYRDIMDSGPRTVGNSPVSSPGLFDPTTRRSANLESLNDGLYSTPWLHPAHRQPPKETHIADVQADPISGRKIVNQYEIIDELGRGVHGKVKLGKDLAHARYVAIKIVDRYSKRRRLGKNTSHEDKIKREIAILKKARHPNIVSLLEVIDDPAKRKVYIVLEHVELGEVKWRSEGAKEICLVEWRRIKRESKGIFDNDSAQMEDEKIMRVAHQQLAREQRRMARRAQAQLRRQESNPGQSWSLEFAMDSDDEYSEAGCSSQASHHGDERHTTRVQFSDRQDSSSQHDDSMETAFRSPTPLSSSIPTGLEGTMYGAYDNEFIRGRTASIAESSSSHMADNEEDIPEHFHWVPLMTTQAAWEAFKDTVLGLEYLHYQNVIHRDIKPANLLVTKEHRIKISDFGVSYLGRQKTEEGTGDHSESEYQEVDEAIELAKTVGTPAFYAPELCRTEIDVDTPLIDGGIDVWALGVTLYCLIYGRVPFHDTNPFVLMKVISEDEPYIPRYRLKPVAETPNSRPSSHGRNSQPTMSSKRAPHDLEYEEVDENLRDLLSKLLIKDARHRITIPEIKQHPWLLSGIPNRVAWAEETDPSRSYDGGKIEISKADVDMAVVPIGFVERIRSAVKKTSDFVAKGFTRSSGSRRRAQSTATHQNPPPNISANSSSSTISQDGRRGSLAPIAILERIGLSREADHPLSHSVTASPEARERTKFFDSPDSRTGSPAQGVDNQRPHLQDRSISSVHTVRQADLLYGGSASPALPPALPGTPTALDTPGGSQLSGLFGGLPRRVVNSMRSNKNLKGAKDHSRTKSIDRLYEGDDDPHGMPSLALSTTNASGQVDQPDALKDLSPVARCASPSLSDAFSFGRLGTSSRQSSTSSLKSSRLQRNWAAANEVDVGPNLSLTSEYRPDHSYGRSTLTRHSQQFDTGRRPSYPIPSVHESSEDQFNRAKAEQIRLRVREARERSNSSTQPRPASALSQSACPPSPDDELGYQRVTDYLSRRDPSTENSPVGGDERGLAFCSSEEQFTSMSQSTSNPSIPSVASAGSSAPDECAPLDYYSDMMPTSSASLNANRFEVPIDDLAGYEGDHAVESNDDSDSEGDVLFIGASKRKSQAKLGRSNSISIAEVARSNAHPESFSHRRRSARSGSNGTVKKIPPPAATSDEHTPTLETS